MKAIIKSTACVILSIVFVFCLISCNTVEKAGVWENATYRKDTELGSGAKTLKVEVKAEEQTVTFTVKTDKATVGEALMENGLIDGENGPYGIYVKSVIGLTLDYETDGMYWAFYIGEELSPTGADMTEIADGQVYRFVATKG